MPVLTKINTNSIAEDAITGDKFAGDAYLANTATQNISGTYSESRMYTSDAYTLSGNATINSNVVLSTVKPNSDVVLTAGGAYTLTGTGVLAGGTVMGQQRSDLTGMTGTLGNAVIGSPALHLGNTTIDSGQVVQIVVEHDIHNKDINDTSNYHSVISAWITPKYSNSKIWMSGGTRMKHANTSPHQWSVWKWERRTITQTDVGSGTSLDAESYTGASGGLPSSGINIGFWSGFVDFPATTDPILYDLQFHNNYSGTHTAQGPHSIQLVEIKG